MKKRNERTSARVARIAAKVLASSEKRGLVQVVLVDGREIRRVHPDVSWSDIRALAASVLTQAADKADIQRLRKRLEITHVWVSKGGKMVRRKLDPGEDIPDGIQCLQARLKAADKPKRKGNGA